jgi:hypothetical protein
MVSRSVVFPVAATAASPPESALLHPFAARAESTACVIRFCQSELRAFTPIHE